MKFDDNSSKKLNTTIQMDDPNNSFISTPKCGVFKAIRCAIEEFISKAEDEK